MKEIIKIVLPFLLVFVSVGNQVSAKTIATDTIYSQVDVIPQFSGGARGWNSFLNKHLDVKKIMWSVDEDTYIKYGLVQRAQLEFTVCEDGRICDIEVLNADKISPEFAKEVIRVMNKSPKWRPAQLNGRAVKTRFKQPITVNLKE